MHITHQSPGVRRRVCVHQRTSRHMELFAGREKIFALTSVAEGSREKE